MDPVEDLQVRIAYQESAIDELTRTLLRGEQRMAELERALQQLQQRVQELERKQPSASSEAEVPPHY
ncbi:MAG TPA: SlyX family protein [Chromatiaceae bacterium]|nr:SlyX family protein [Chromatiaceae bacterium]